MPKPDVTEQIRHALDSAPLDQDTQQKLDLARRQALEAPAPASYPPFAKPALGLASLAVIALLITLALPEQQSTMDIEAIETFEIITSRDELEMFENLEFYLWLEQQLETQPPQQTG